MEGKTIESLRQLLEIEGQSDSVTKLPNDAYSKLATYMQKLRQSSRETGEDPTSRLIKKQSWLLKGMVEELLRVRLEKVTRSKSTKNLLPEEKYVCAFYTEFETRRDTFTQAVTNGQPSFFTVVQKSEMEKMVTIRFLKPLGEIIGFDLKRYGPFNAHDVAQIPAGNAEVLIENGEATQVLSRDGL